MSEKVEVSKREQVLAMLKEGVHTREQIATALSMSVASVSSQFTYLRWMGNYITYDANKVMSLATKEEYDVWAASREGQAKKAAVSKKTVEEQTALLGKTIETQTKQLSTWALKLNKINDDLKAMPDDEELTDMRDEAGANVVLLGIKLKRNKKRLTELPAIEASAEPEEAELDDAADLEDITGEEDDLM